jgi:hypothetical protein
VVRIWWIVSQQLGQRGSPGLMHGGSQSGFHRFQVESAVAVALLKNNAQKSVYFAGDFLLDDFGRFFSWADGRVSTGRNSQICSLTLSS